MWPFNDRKLRRVTPYRAYLRGRVRPTLSEAEVERYLSAPLPVVIGFVLGSIASESEGTALPTEAEVDIQVKTRLGYPPPRAPGVGVVEVRIQGKGRDDGGAAPAAAAAAARWIGDPLAPTPTPAG